MKFLENLFEDGILKIKFGILKFLENLFEDGIFLTKINFGILENYFENEILENYLKIEVKKKIIWKFGILKIILKK